MGTLISPPSSFLHSDSFTSFTSFLRELISFRGIHGWIPNSLRNHRHHCFVEVDPFVVVPTKGLSIWLHDTFLLGSHLSGAYFMGTSIFFACNRDSFDWIFFVRNRASPRPSIPLLNCIPFHCTIFLINPQSHFFPSIASMLTSFCRSLIKQCVTRSTLRFLSILSCTQFGIFYVRLQFILEFNIL